MQSRSARFLSRSYLENNVHNLYEESVSVFEGEKRGKVGFEKVVSSLIVCLSRNGGEEVKVGEQTSQPPRGGG